MNLNKLTLGVDIESISRFDSLDRKKDKIFLNKIYTKKELDYCYSNENYAQHLAARFTAKEAIIKAISSSGLNLPFYNEIEISNEKNGSPYVKIKSFKKIKVKLSLSHCDEKALAFVVMEIPEVFS